MPVKKSLVVGLISIGILIPLFQNIAVAKTAKEIREIARVITVEILGKNNKGSGVILDRSGNTYTVLTSAHVLKQNDGYRITTPDRRTYQIIRGSIRRSERNIDLAVFKFQALGNSFYSTASELGIGDCYLLREGMTIYVGGFPVNSKNSDLAFYPGEVSSNSFKNFKNGYALVYSNDTFPGMSGGPVLNTDGQLVAIHGRGDKDEKNNDLSENEQKTGFNLAIPINIFVSIASKLGVSINFKLYPTTTRSNNALTANDYMGTGMYKYSSGDYRGALADYDRAIVLNPNSAENYIIRGMLKCAVVGEKASGIADLDRAARIYKSQNKDREYRSTIDLIKLYQDRPDTISYGNFIVDRTSSEIGDIVKGITVKVSGQRGNGSGAIVQKNGNIYTVLTAASVITTNQVDRVVTSDNKTYKIISSSIRRSVNNLDLSVFQFRSPVSYPIAIIGDDNNLSQGIDLYVGGFPMTTAAITESTFVFRRGNLVKNNSNSLKNDYSIAYNNDILTGMEGGPVLDTRGELVAIHTKETTEQNNDNSIRRKQLNFGIPIKYFVAIAGNLGVNLPPRSESLSRIDTDLTAEGKINAGMKRYQLSDWQGALTEFNDALKLNANYAQAYYLRGTVHENLENWQAAIADYREAARIYQKQGKNDEYLMVMDRLKNIQNR
ncbi:trypsin-like peptidase domain-containing protein [Chamaesiphon sp. VAR_48_metabat_403]|uniref:trypsin-like peptidase domain-containing protein n=1 Tax=Chamaesiphon sp. VAR_48_metabat_403 TaxID=2964700 RepID=UPI00286DA53E|nr:trypsin-like peptidase domain-containing protein [Chamaesiphon sp. VAR_48_metabat_403]